MCFPRTQICSPLLLQLLCSLAHLCMPGDDRVPGVWHREDTILGDLSALPGSIPGMTSRLFLQQQDGAPQFLSGTEQEGDIPPAVSCGCPCHGPGLESRAGKSEGFWLVSDPINQRDKIWFRSPLLCLSAGNPSCFTRPELKYFALGYLT